MNTNVTYLPETEIQDAVTSFSTPFFLYKEERIRENCQRIKQAFDPLFPHFTPLYAVKANPNPDVVQIILDEGFGLDCSSMAEAWLAGKLDAPGMHTGNYITNEEIDFIVNKTQLLLNLDDASMLDAVVASGIPQMISFRINPAIGGSVSLESNVLAGPDAKYGIPWEQAIEAYRRAKALGVRRFGIHMMTGSNVLDEAYFGEITRKLLTVIADLKKELGIEIEVMNIGGGFGVPYSPEESSLDMVAVARAVRDAYDEVCVREHIAEPRLMVEPGRYITADAGWLVGRVTVIKKGYKTFVGIDASANDMPRPSIYGAYHHITALSHSNEKDMVSVVGSICENNDQFAKDRVLPRVSVGDILVIHNCGGHAYAMGHNYNGKTRHAEYLLTEGGEIRCIRKAESIQDLFRGTSLVSS